MQGLCTLNVEALTVYAVYFGGTGKSGYCETPQQALKTSSIYSPPTYEDALKYPPIKLLVPLEML